MFQLEVTYPPINTSELDPSLAEPTQINLYALMGHLFPQTLRVMGHINKSHVDFLFDSGSTHYFLRDCVVKKLGMAIDPAQSFQVLVDNEEQLQCTTMCSLVHLFLGTHKLLVDLFILPLS